jgi:hypothetical protein
VNQRKPLRRRKALRRMSDKRRALQDDLRALKVEAWARDRGCRAALIVPEVPCAGPLDLDHVRSLGRGGARLSLDNVAILCRAHHDWKDTHPDEANRRGLWPHSWETPPVDPRG